MTKKTASTSNVPQTGNKINANSQGGSKKQTKSPQKNKNNVSGVISGSSSSSNVLNSKHLHNHSTPKIKPKTKRAESDQQSSHNGNTLEEIESNELMKKLFEAVQKQKATENGGGKPRSRKGTAPPRTINSSETYAGAAFDRAPAAASFPIPSFIKTPTGSDSGVSNFSSSCPLPSSIESKKMVSPSSPNLKTLSISELFKNEQQQQQQQIPNQSEPQASSEQSKLQSLTNDLRKILNLH